MQNQASHTLEYIHDPNFYNQFQSRPPSTYASKVRSMPCETPSKNQVNFNQTPLMYLNNYQIPAFTVSQPMHPFNIHSNRSTPTPNQIYHESINTNYTSDSPIKNPLSIPNQSTTSQHHKQDKTPFPSLNHANFTLKFKSNKKFSDVFRDYFYLEDYIKSIKPSVSLVKVYINKNDELIIKTDNQEHRIKELASGCIRIWLNRTSQK